MIYPIAVEISFNQSLYWANESIGVIQPVLHLSNPSLTNIMVEVFTTDITAFGKWLYCDNDMERLCITTGANVDYGFRPYQVTILAGNITSVPFDVKIKNDDILEDNETFRLTINISSLPGCINYAVPYQATVVIVDDDGKFIDNQFYFKILYFVWEDQRDKNILINAIAM